MCDKKDAGMDRAERAVPESVGGPVPSPPGGRTWEELMRMAIGLAAGAEARVRCPWGRLSPIARDQLWEKEGMPLWVPAIPRRTRKLWPYAVPAGVLATTVWRAALWSSRWSPAPCAPEPLFTPGWTALYTVPRCPGRSRGFKVGSSGRFLPEPPGMAYGRSAERGMRRSYPYLFCKTPLKHVKREKSPNT
jgi:hypothetical protein